MRDLRFISRMRSQAGLSLVELLAALLIASLVSIIMATGIPTAIRAYQRVVDSSNALLLLSTTTNRLRSELSVADPASLPENLTEEQAVVFTSMRTGYLTRISCDELHADGSQKCPQIREIMVDEATDKAYDPYSEAGTEINPSTFAPVGSSTMVSAIPLVSDEKCSESTTAKLVATVGSISYDKTKRVFTVKDISILRFDTAGHLANVEGFAGASIPTFEIQVIAAS